jgi:hypothetical protein
VVVLDREDRVGWLRVMVTKVRFEQGLGLWWGERKNLHNVCRGCVLSDWPFLLVKWKHTIALGESKTAGIHFLLGERREKSR